MLQSIKLVIFLLPLYCVTYSQQIKDLSSECQYNQTFGTMVTCNYGNKTISKLLKVSRPYLDLESWKSLSVIGNSDVTDFPLDYFTGIKNIETLSFHGTRLQSIPNIFMNLQQVYTMDLSLNEIEIVSTVNIQKLGIRHLNVSRNTIRYLEPDDLSWISSVEILDISNNKITDIPKDYFRSTRLIRKLILSFNSLRTIHEYVFSGLETSLQELYLAENQISDIHPLAFNNLLELKLLDLSGNPFNLKIDVSSIKLPQHIAHLDLHKTALTKLDFCFIQHLHDLEFINLQENDLECSCDLLWVMKHLKRHYYQSPTARPQQSETRCINADNHTETVSALEPVCRNKTKQLCSTVNPLSELLQNLKDLHYMVEIRKGKIWIHWGHLNSSLIYAYRISVKEESEEGYFYGPVTIHSSSDYFKIESSDLKNTELKVCLQIMTNETFDLYTKCAFVEDESLSSIVGILAGILFLIPCLIALTLVIYYDKKHHLRQQLKDRLLHVSESDSEDEGSNVYKQEVNDEIVSVVTENKKKTLHDGVVLNSTDLSCSVPDVSVKFITEESLSSIQSDLSTVEGQKSKSAPNS